MVRVALAIVLVTALAGCATTTPPTPAPTLPSRVTWDMWTTASAGGLVVGTFSEAHCAAVSKEFGAVAPCRHVRLSADAARGTATLWLARFEVPQPAGRAGPQMMMGHPGESNCLLALERAMRQGLILVDDCRRLGVVDLSDRPRTIGDAPAGGPNIAR